MKEKYIVVRKCVEGDKGSEIKMVFFSVPLRLVQFFIYKLKSTTSIYASLCRIFTKTLWHSWVIFLSKFFISAFHL